MPLQVGGFGKPKKARVRKYVVGLYCGAAYHEVPFAQQQDCEVVRLYDAESDMCKLAELFFRRGGPRGDVVKQFDRKLDIGDIVHEGQLLLGYVCIYCLWYLGTKAERTPGGCP